MANINLSGSISATGVSILGSASVIFATDADHTLSVPEYTNNFLTVTSSVSLTATRQLIAPVVSGQAFVVQNQTTGGQSITVIGATGTGITITNGSMAAVVCDGTNYLQVGGGTAGGDLSGTYPNPTVINIHGNPVTAQTLTSTQDGYVLTWDNTDGYWEAIAPVSTLYGGTHNGGAGVVLWNNASTAPTSNPTGGSIVYEKSGTLTQRGSGGLTFDIAPSGSGTVNTQAAVINRKIAYLRTSSAFSATTIFSYTIPYSVTNGAVAYVEVVWSARDTTGNGSTAIAGSGRGAAMFVCSSGGTVTQQGVVVSGTPTIHTMFTIGATNTYRTNFNMLSFDNTTTTGFTTANTVNAISYTTATSGGVNILVTAQTTSNIDWTADIYIQVT
jgi:hypothetical protein